MPRPRSTGPVPVSRLLKETERWGQKNAVILYPIYFSAPISLPHNELNNELNKRTEDTDLADNNNKRTEDTHLADDEWAK